MAAKRKWVTGKALETVIRLGAVKRGDEIKMKHLRQLVVAMSGSRAKHLIDGVFTITDIDEPPHDMIPLEISAVSAGGDGYSDYVSYNDIGAWRPKKEGE